MQETMQEIREKIKDIVYRHIKRIARGGGIWDDNEEIEVAAAELAKLFEEDKWDAMLTLGRTWEGIQEIHLANLATAQAQIAAMAEALEKIEDNPPIYNNTSELRGWVEEARAVAAEALSPVKVLHRENVKWDTEWLVWPVIRVKRPPMIDYRGPDDVLPGVSLMAHDPKRYDEFPGQQANLIVFTKCSEEGKQADSTEQDNAQEEAEAS